MKNVKLNSEQQAALEKIKQGGNCIILGNAGTGKSTLLRHLHEAIPEAVFVAPTGAAARLDWRRYDQQFVPHSTPAIHH